MKRTVSLTLVLIFICIGLTSCGIPPITERALEEKVNGAIFVSYSRDGSFEMIVFFVDRDASVSKCTKYGSIVSSDYREWEVESSPLTGAYVLIGDEKYIYDSSVDVLERKSDGKIFERDDTFIVS